MGCREPSSRCSTETDDPLYLRRLSQGISRGSLSQSNHLFCMMWIAGWLWSQCKGNGPHLNLVLGTFCIPVVTSVFFLSCDHVVGDSLEFNQANCGSLRVLLGKRNCSGHNAGKSGLISRRGESLMGFLELRQEPGVYSRVTAGMSIRNWSLFSEVRTPV